MSDPWRIVFMGTPEPAALSLENLLEGPDPVVGVVTQPDRPAGRGRQLIPSPVKKVALSNQVPVLMPLKARDPEFLSALKKWNPRLIVVVAYGKILPKDVLDLPQEGCINVHYSLLPKYRGASPVTWAILKGERETGVSTMRLVEKMDAGPILLQEKLPIDSEETTGSLTAKLAPMGSRLLLETIRQLKEGSLRARPQDETSATHASMLKKEDGKIDWQRSAEAIERAVRAFNPWPSAYTYWQENLLKIYRAKVVANSEGGSPGEVLRADPGGFWIATGDGILSVEELQMENRKRLPAADFIRGTRIEKGERF